MKSAHGFTLLEVLAVVAVAGLALAVASTALGPDRLAVGQAARGLGAEVARARLEAIRSNSFGGLLVDVANNRYVVWVDCPGVDTAASPCADVSRSYDAGDEVRVGRFGRGSLAGARLVSSGFTAITFDPRGAVWSFVNGGSRLAAEAAVVVGGRRSNFQVTVRVSPQGRVRR